MQQQVTWDVVWQAVTAVVALIAMIVGGGSLYVRMSIRAAISELFEALDKRYVRRDEVELISMVSKIKGAAQ